MIDDRNKTKLTKQVTAAAMAWLDEKGFKPVETEVWVGDSWVADLAGVIVPTQTELINLKIITRRPDWNSEKYADWKKGLELFSQLLSVIVEVKTSSSDFSRDKKWKRTDCPANLCYMAMSGFGASYDRIPKSWGILKYLGTRGIRCERPAMLNLFATEDQKHKILALLYQVAIRRDHRTRYAMLRDNRRAWEDEDNRRQNLTRFRQLLRYVSQIVEGKLTIDEAIRNLGYYESVPAYLYEELKSIVSLMKKPEVAA